MFLAPNFFWGSAPEFLEWDYKIRPDCDHVAKFQGDRSRELGERVAKKNIRAKYKPVRNGCSGRPNKLWYGDSHIYLLVFLSLALLALAVAYSTEVQFVCVLAFGRSYMVHVTDLHFFVLQLGIT